MRRTTSRDDLDARLLALLASPADGYGVVGALRQQGHLDGPDGAVYPALHRLERAGLLRSHWDDRAGRRRRIYQVSAPGAVASVARTTARAPRITGRTALTAWPA